MSDRALRSDGRWGGEITRRPLPSAAAELGELDHRLRGALARVWWLQAATEARVATSFTIVHRSLIALEADAGLIAIAERAIDDERRHAALCEEMAKRYAGHDLPPHPVLPHTHPMHARARSEGERAALYIVGQCALNETLACAYLTLSRTRCESALARAALSELLQDEVDHSRLGWAFLQSVSAPIRQRLSEWLLPLTICNLREWMDVASNAELDLEAHGVPRREPLEAALEEAVRGVVVRGFQHVGLDTRALESWVASGMSLD